MPDSFSWKFPRLSCVTAMKCRRPRYQKRNLGRLDTKQAYRHIGLLITVIRTYGTT